MDGYELNDLRELVEFLKANEIAEFDVERGDLKLRLKFAGAAPAPQTSAMLQPGFPPGFYAAQLSRMMASTSPEMTQASAVSTLVAATSAAPVGVAVAEVKHHVVKSPIVGTFYESPSPGSLAFVKVGDVVEVGQVLCIVEAMKLMNEIESDAAGEVMERIAVVGQPVEYGQALFSIKT